MDIFELQQVPLGQLRQMAKDLYVPRASRLKKEDLILRIRQA